MIVITIINATTKLCFHCPFCGYSFYSESFPLLLSFFFLCVCSSKRKTIQLKPLHKIINRNYLYFIFIDYYHYYRYYYSISLDTICCYYFLFWKKIEKKKQPEFYSGIFNKRRAASKQKLNQRIITLILSNQIKFLLINQFNNN